MQTSINTIKEFQMGNSSQTSLIIIRILGVFIFNGVFYFHYEIMPPHWLDGPGVGDTYPNWYSIPLFLVLVLLAGLSPHMVLFPKMWKEYFKW